MGVPVWGGGTNDADDGTLKPHFSLGGRRSVAHAPHSAPPPPPLSPPGGRPRARPSRPSWGASRSSSSAGR